MKSSKIPSIAAGIALLTWCWLPVSQADTIMMKSGVQIEGIVRHEADGILEVQIGERTMRLRSNEVHEIEKNDRDGSLDLEALQEEADRQDKALTEQTGLDRAQRELVLQHIGLLTDPDSAKSSAARRALIAMGAEADLFPFIEFVLPSYLPNTVLILLKILAELDPVKIQPIALKCAFFSEEHVRGLALELLASPGSADALELAMRGMLDHTDTVKSSACKALAILKAKEATPLLLRIFNHKDLRVQNNARQTLASIWQGEADKTAPDTLEAWESFWSDQETGVPKSIDLETLEPLVAPGTHFPGC